MWNDYELLLLKAYEKQKAQKRVKYENFMVNKIRKLSVCLKKKIRECCRDGLSQGDQTTGFTS